MATNEHNTTHPETEAWCAAFSRYQSEEAAYDRAAADYSATCETYYRESPDRTEEFAAYGLRFGKDREQLIRNAEVAIAIRDYKGHHISPELFDAATEEATRVVDAFLAYRKQHSEAFERIVEPAERKHDAAVDARHKAREALLNTPAPDGAAIAVKLDVLAAIMEGDQNYEYVAPIRADARRLLGRA